MASDNDCSLLLRRAELLLEMEDMGLAEVRPKRTNKEGLSRARGKGRPRSWLQGTFLPLAAL